MSGVHGTAYIASGPKISKSMKIIYRIFFSVCFLTLMANVTFLLQESWSSEAKYVRRISKDTSIGMLEDPDYFPTYPRITICRKPFYETELNDTYMEMVEYAALALGYPFTTLTPQETSLLANIHLHGDKKDFNLHHPEAWQYQERLQDLQRKYENWKGSGTFDVGTFLKNHSARCEDLFDSCQVMGALNCCALFQPILTNMGLCYTLSSAREIDKLQGVSPVDYAFSIDLHSPLLPAERLTEVGFQVFMSDPLEKIPKFFADEGQRIVNGLATTIAVELVKVDRTALYRAWHGQSRSCPTMPFKDTERYTHKACPDFYIEHVLRSSCNCQPVISPDEFPGWRRCDPVDNYDCMMKSSLKSNLSDFDQICHDPCILYLYRSTASYVGLGGENMSRILILYNSKQYIFNEHRTVTLSALFSRIGGALGLYLGASIITVVEILEFILSWNWHAVVPSKTYRRGR